MAIIRAEAVGKVYITQAEKVVALRDVDFQLNRSDFVLINGPSGSGKTTLLNLLSGIDRPTSGRLYLEETPMGSFTDNHRTKIRRDKIGLIFQSFELIPVLTAGENVEYPLLLQKVSRRERRERVVEILERVGMEKMADRLPSQLSGGQKQRVAIARALVTRPKVVLADEPTGNLDTRTGIKIVQLMLDLNRKYGVAFVIVSHDLALNQLAKDVYLIRDGILTLKKGG
jgi:putative ABC transport system ATP-binding protein